MLSSILAILQVKFNFCVFIDRKASESATRVEPPQPSPQPKSLPQEQPPQPRLQQQQQQPQQHQQQQRQPQPPQQHRAPTTYNEPVHKTSAGKLQ